MLFFYRSHTIRVFKKGYQEKILNAEKYAIPTQFMNLVSLLKKHLTTTKAIGATDIKKCKKRAVSSAFFSGSLTVEAALVLPLFLSSVLLLSGLFQMIVMCSQVNHALCMAGRRMAAYSQSADGVEQGIFYAAFYSEIAKSGIDVSNIEGGYSGFMPKIECVNQGKMYQLSSYFWMRMPGLLLPSRKIRAVETVYIRPWTGATLAEYQRAGGKQSEDRVYMAENGVVYHKDPTCTYLDLSIRVCTLATAKEAKNKYGAHYVQCERCGYLGEDNMKVYITDTGRAWHTDRTCSGLKRTLDGMSQEEAENKGLRPCPRCQ